jgi:formylmethanofuran dehydrogenase subunit C
VSESVTLSLRMPLDGAIEVDGVTADRFAELNEREIATLPARAGERAAALGDFFTVRGGRSARVRVEGPLSRVSGIGAGMAGGELTIDGSAGSRVCAGMTGGRAEVRGDVLDEAGIAMGGGVLCISGSAGDRLGAALPGATKGLTAGEIVVRGSAGSDTAARSRCGLVVVGGDTGAFAARAMVGGTLVVLGRTGRDPGLRSRLGTIIAVGGVAVPVAYWLACTFEPPHVRLTLAYLRRKHGLAIDDAVAGGAYRRYCGNAGDQDRGEILEWAGPRRNRR